MSNDTDLDMDMSGPTVTLFGDLDALGGAVSDELSYRGLSTHAVTTPMGWINSVQHAVVRLGTPIGERAFEALAAGGTPPAHVVAVCERSRDDVSTARREKLCRQAGEHHTVTLIWHPPLELRLGDIGPDLAPRELAVAIADEVADLAGRTAPGFVERTLHPRAKGLA
ncbi:hypothetical protein [Aeromicrobium wangtongii]|uniref:Uncharacterized protein n=1 Tax=Aeromicrobium wangtongii TaxID=2969247 RepID=A0ABY5MB14_9ACTN|nr:hypothetical protein [Aeromicrobium wangtongii]MCD9199520.1 hypothetical protein [Aeromicrobium wangtongii]UUP13873.1 hypothetical protein NQV15_00760 [Aeromicrobium wangtongii]